MEMHCRYTDNTYYRLYFVAGKCTLLSSYLSSPLSLFSNCVADIFLWLLICGDNWLFGCKFVYKSVLLKCAMTRF